MEGDAAVPTEASTVEGTPKIFQGNVSEAHATTAGSRATWPETVGPLEAVPHVPTAIRKGSLRAEGTGLEAMVGSTWSLKATALLQQRRASRCLPKTGKSSRGSRPWQILWQIFDPSHQGRTTC